MCVVNVVSRQYRVEGQFYQEERKRHEEARAKFRPLELMDYVMLLWPLLSDKEQKDFIFWCGNPHYQYYLAEWNRRPADMPDHLRTRMH
jgi:hypothetical protein